MKLSLPKNPPNERQRYCFFWKYTKKAVNLHPEMASTFPEILLHYIWQNRLWAGYEQTTTDGLRVEVLSVGRHNTDADPDFSDVHLRIGETEWAGNVEIHLTSSDWYKHRHHLDAAYDSVVLHVVRHADKRVYNSRGEAIVQCELNYPDDPELLTRLLTAAQKMDSAENTIECHKLLLQDPTLLTDGWRKSLLQKRLDCKRQSIEQLLNITQHSWEHAFYITLAHNFGFHTNGIPFETMAIQTPLAYLQKHRNSLFQQTAILLGQSGLLTEQTAQSDEEQRLLKEYRFLQKKFSLTPIDGYLWKKARMRPQAFPEVRIRQFAQLLHQSEFLFSRLMDETDIESLVSLFTLKPTADDTQRLTAPAAMGRNSINILLINSVVPYKYAYALARKDKAAIDKAMALMEQIAAEDNSVVRQWVLLGQTVRTAADSQALIHLYQNYCQSSRCINCEVGYQVFLKQAQHQ